MFGISIIKTARLREMEKQLAQKDVNILRYEDTIADLREQVDDLTPKRDKGGRFISADTTEATGASE